MRMFTVRMLALCLCVGLIPTAQAQERDDMGVDPRVVAWDKAAEGQLPQNCNPADLMALLDSLSKAKDEGKIADPREVVRIFVETTTNLDEAKAFLLAAEKYWPGISAEDWATNLAAAKIAGYTTPKLIASDETGKPSLRVVSYLSKARAAELQISKIKVEVTVTRSSASTGAARPGKRQIPAEEGNAVPPTASFTFEMLPATGPSKHKFTDGMDGLLEDFEAGVVTFKYTPVYLPREAAVGSPELGEAAQSVGSLTRHHPVRLDRAVLERSGKRHFRQYPDPARNSDSAAAAWALRSFYDDRRNPDPVPAPPAKNEGKNGGNQLG